MKVTSEKMENCQIALNIEVEPDELGKSLDEAYHGLVKKVSIPGFRKGKAPRAILEQYVGEDALLREVLDRLIPQLYKQAIEQEKIEPIAQPKVEVSQKEPMVLKAIVPIKPEVKLGDYHSIKLEPEPVEIGDKEIEAAIEELRQEQAVLMPVDRPIQFGDWATIDIEAKVEGKPFLNHKEVVYEVDSASASPLPGFAESLEGVEKGKEKAFKIAAPANYDIKEFAGKECDFRVTVTEIKERRLPELNDEFAKSSGYDNLSQMRERIAVDLRAKAEEKSRLELRRKVIDAVVESSEVSYPPILEDREVDKLLANEVYRFGYREVSEYLKRSSKTEEEIRQELRPTAKQRIIHSLVLDKIAEEEKIEITSSEVDDKIKEIAKDAEEREKMEKILSSPQVRESIEQSLCTEKTINRLVQIASGIKEG
jgi:trigger factor